jgi:hypothetical protein
VILHCKERLFGTGGQRPWILHGTMKINGNDEMEMEAEGRRPKAEGRIRLRTAN